MLTLCFLHLPDGGVDGASQLHILTVNETVAPPDELVYLVGVAGAGLDVFAHGGRHPQNLLAGQLIS